MRSEAASPSSPVLRAVGKWTRFSKLLRGADTSLDVVTLVFGIHHVDMVWGKDYPGP